MAEALLSCPSKTLVFYHSGGSHKVGVGGSTVERPFSCVQNWHRLANGQADLPTNLEVCEVENQTNKTLTSVLGGVFS